MAKKQFSKGEQFGQWQLQEPFRGGGNSFVWLASNGKESKVIKLLKKDHDKAKQRFIDEVSTMINNSDVDGVMKILDSSELTPQTDSLWYVMDRGETLERYLRLAEPGKIVYTVAQVADILSKLHDRGVAHRDIKPQNLFVVNGTVTIGDFGLVDYPNKQSLTMKADPLGPRWTIAPEMRQNPEKANATKSDVYSLAKTLWILLTGIEKGFEGQYNPDGSIGIIHYQPTIFNSYLDKLLLRATENEPSRRPVMKEFALGLHEWVRLNENFYEQNAINWAEIQAKLFPTSLPQSVEWTEINSIVSILNIIGSIPSLNHMFMPGGGGLDLEGAKLAGENGFIELDMGIPHLIKPSKLTFESFNDDPEWNYFRLEADKVETIFNQGDRKSEEITEVGPGQYEDYYARDRYYEQHGKWPKDWRTVVRYFEGSFVIFQKTSSYNYTPSTYDGRHSKVDGPTFRDYIQKAVSTGYKVVRYNEDGLRGKQFLNGTLSPL
jgi:serine/threonine protein kinase